MGICQLMPFLVWDRTRGLKSTMKNKEGQFIREIFPEEINLDFEIIVAGSGICLDSLEKKQS